MTGPEVTAAWSCCDHRNTEYGNCTDCMNTGHNHSSEMACKPEVVDAGLVERAAQAAVANDPHLADAVIGGKVTAWTWETIPELGRSNYLVMMRHALAAVMPEIQAQALRDAADEVSGYAWQPGDAPARVMPIEEQRAYMGGANDAHTIVDRLLRERAARLTATPEEPK